MHAQCSGHSEQVAGLHLFASLHALERVARESGLLEEPFLRPAKLYAADADTIADSPAGFDDPVGMFGGRIVNAAPKMILS